MYLYYCSTGQMLYCTGILYVLVDCRGIFSSHLTFTNLYSMIYVLITT